jgi:hypothetical protein
MLALPILGCEFGRGNQNIAEPKSTRLIDFDFPDVAKEFTIYQKGYLVRISVLRPSATNTKKNDVLVQTLKVQITGDAIVNLGVVVIPVRTKQVGGVEAVDPSQRHVACFLQAAKDGQATVKITPIGFDGKELPSKEWKINVKSGEIP